MLPRFIVRTFARRFVHTAAACLVAATFPAAAGSLNEIGSSKAIVFSPDLADPGNRAFYERLGFLYIETADWSAAFDELTRANQLRPTITSLIVESHGTNGNGLKLQGGKHPGDARSYVSLNALRERLRSAGVNIAILTACNAGRLFRPAIVSRLDRENGDPLFLPPTAGIVETSPDSAPSPDGIYRREDSNLETLLHVSSREFPPVVRSALGAGSAPVEISVSTFFIQLMLDDPDLRLTDSGWVEQKSRDEIPLEHSEELFARFGDWLADHAR